MPSHPARRKTEGPMPKSGAKKISASNKKKVSADVKARTGTKTKALLGRAKRKK